MHFKLKVSEPEFFSNYLLLSIQYLINILAASSAFSELTDSKIFLSYLSKKPIIQLDSSRYWQHLCLNYLVFKHTLFHVGQPHDRITGCLSPTNQSVSTEPAPHDHRGCGERVWVHTTGNIFTQESEVYFTTCLPMHCFFHLYITPEHPRNFYRRHYAVFTSRPIILTHILLGTCVFMATQIPSRV